MSDTMSPEEINATIRYVAWAVFGRRGDLPSGTAERLDAWIEDVASQDITLRGLYDTSTLRADGDVLVWLHGPTAEGLQRALRDLRRIVFGRAVDLEWSAMALHRPAEFNKRHVPVFLSGLPAQDWVVVYPFVRSYEWYLLPDAERRDLLREHGEMAHKHATVYNSTLAAFAMGDYEWLLAIEGEQLHEIVDLMRDLRASGARRHVRAELPFYVGRLVTPAEALAVLE